MFAAVFHSYVHSLWITIILFNVKDGPMPLAQGWAHRHSSATGAPETVVLCQLTGLWGIFAQIVDGIMEFCTAKARLSTGCGLR